MSFKLGLLIFILTISISNVAYCQIKKTPKSEIPTLQKQYENAIASGNKEKAISDLRLLKKAYSDNFIWDSLEVTQKRLSVLGLETGDMQTHVEFEYAYISFNQMMKRPIEDMKGRLFYLNRIAETEDISYINQCNVSFGIGRMYRDMGVLDSSEIWHAKAVRLSDFIDEKESHRTMYRINWAESLWELGRNNQAIEVLFDAEEASEKMEKKNFPQMRIYDVLGKIFNEVDDFDKAEFYYRKAMRIGEENKLPTYYNVSRLLLGELLTKYGKIEEGRSLLNMCKSYINKKKLSIHGPALYSTIASGYLQQKNIAMSKRYIDSTMTIAQNIGGHILPLLHYKNKLTYHLLQGQLGQAKSVLSQLESDDKRTDDFVAIHGMKYDYYKAAGNDAKALYHFERFKSLKDSVNSRNQILQTQRIEAQYNRQKQDIEISSLNQTKVAQEKALAVRNTAIVLGSIMIFILLGLLYGLYRLFKKNRENQAALAKQNIQITKALEENKILMKEIHHRVKNNLQVISSLLNMQARKVTDGETKDALNSSKTRVQTMSLLHQKLYSNDNLKDVNVDEYISDLVDNIVDTYHINENIKINIDVEKMSYDVDVLVPLGLITNELICNALKHAFEPGQKGELTVSLKETATQLVLEVKDNGKGLETNDLPMKEGSLGVRLIKSFTNRMDGNIEVQSNNGTSIKISIDKSKLDV